MNKKVENHCVMTKNIVERNMNSFRIFKVNYLQIVDFPEIQINTNQPRG